MCVYMCGVPHHRKSEKHELQHSSAFLPDRLDPDVLWAVGGTSTSRPDPRADFLKLMFTTNQTERTAGSLAAGVRAAFLALDATLARLGVGRDVLRVLVSEVVPFTGSRIRMGGEHLVKQAGLVRFLYLYVTD